MSDMPHDHARRQLLRAMAASGLLAGFESLLPAYARIPGADNGRHLTETAARVPGGAPRDVTMDFHIRREKIDIAGGHGSAITINHSVPGPIVELWQGRTARLRIHNHMEESTSIHWHGILLPFRMDGVPGVAFPGLEPENTFEAYFPVRQYGTYWYHSHTSVQEQVGQTGPIVIHPAEERVQADRDYVLVLNDWTFEDPHRLLAKLKEMPDYYNFSRRTMNDLIQDVAQAGFKKTMSDRLGWGKMRMSPRDIADVTSYTYSYLMNGMHPEANWTGLFNAGETVRLRVINASAMTYFNFRIPGLPMQVVAADGQNVEPVETDEFQIGVAETFDVLLKPRADTAYTLMAESMDRSGYARGTLAPRAGMSAPVPALRAQPQRTMIDMGMDMSKMDMGGKGQKKAMMQRSNQAHTGMVEVPHKAHEGVHEGHDAMAGMPMAGTGAMMERGGPIIARHGPDDHGPGNTVIAKAERYRLAERGTGLEGIDHRVLTYSQLRNVKPMADKR